MSHWVSVNASMFALGPPKREPVPEHGAAEGDVRLVGDCLLVDVNDAGRYRVGDGHRQADVAEDAERQAVLRVRRQA